MFAHQRYDLRAHVVAVDCVHVEAIEKPRRRLDTGFLGVQRERQRPSARRRWFAKSCASAASITVTWRAYVRSSINSGARSTTSSVCTKTSPSGCHSGSCGVDQTLNFGKHFFYRSEFRATRVRWTDDALEAGAQLAPYALGRQIAEIHRPAERNGLRIDLKLKALQTAPHATRVDYLRQTSAPKRHVALGGDVLLTAKWIDQLARQWVLEDGIDREVATACRVCDAHRRIALDHKQR